MKAGEGRQKGRMGRERLLAHSHCLASPGCRGVDGKWLLSGIPIRFLSPAGRIFSSPPPFLSLSSCLLQTTFLDFANQQVCFSVVA